MNAEPHSREFEFWAPEPLFAGEMVFCLASGPSLTQEICDRLRGLRTTVVNTSCMLAPWADVLFFTDSGWYEPRKSIVENWPGYVVSMSRRAKRELPDKVLRVQGWGDPAGLPLFPPPQAGTIWQGRTSGHTAVSLSIALGARRIVLVGYDMRVIDGREHHHKEYTGPRDLNQYAREFVPAFNGWAAAGLRAGVEILNATPGSAIKEFPFIDLNEAIACARS